ncbi:MAG: hypothetical protein WCI71_02550 [Bacteroidota bacterium]
MKDLTEQCLDSSMEDQIRPPSYVEKWNEVKFNEFLFEQYIADHIENTIQRMMEYSSNDKPLENDLI